MRLYYIDLDYFFVSYRFITTGFTERIDFFKGVSQEKQKEIEYNEEMLRGEDKTNLTMIRGHKGDKIKHYSVY